MDMPVDEAISFLDAQIAHYGDSELGFQLQMLKLRTYESHNMPQQLTVAAKQVNIENRNEIDKIDYYYLLSQAYQKMGDEESAALYLEKFNALIESGFEGVGA